MVSERVCVRERQRQRQRQRQARTSVALPLSEHKRLVSENTTCKEVCTCVCVCVCVCELCIVVWALDNASIL